MTKSAATERAVSRVLASGMFEPNDECKEAIAALQVGEEFELYLMRKQSRLVAGLAMVLMMNDGVDPRRVFTTLVNAEKTPAIAQNFDASESEAVRSDALKTRDLLRVWVEEWFKAKKSLGQLMRDSPEIRSQVHYYFSSAGSHVFWGESNRPARPQLVFSTHLPYDLEAARLLIAIGTSTLVPRIEICPRCERVFIKKTLKAKSFYCDRTCSNNDGSKRKQRSEEEHRRDKLQRVRKAMRELSPKCAKSWKRMVANRTGATLTWITREVNQDHLNVEDLHKEHGR